MRHLALFALVVLAADADGRDRRCRGARDSRLQDSCAGYAAFEAFPSSGAGTSGACSTTPPTGARGEVATCSRSTVGECYSNDGQTLTQLAAGKCRVSSGAITSSVLGVWLEQGRTNLIARSRAPSNASWTKTNMTCAQTATGMRADVNGASTCTASAGNGTVVQAIVGGPATRTGSLHIKRRTGTGAVEVTMDGGGTWTAITSSLSDTRWRRVVPFETPGCWGGDCIHVLGMVSALANPSIGVRVVTSGDAVDIDFAQIEAGTDATSPIETVGSTVARTEDLVTFSGLTGSPLSLNGSMSASLLAARSFGSWLVTVGFDISNFRAITNVPGATPDTGIPGCDWKTAGTDRNFYSGVVGASYPAAAIFSCEVTGGGTGSAGYNFSYPAAGTAIATSSITSTTVILGSTFIVTGSQPNGVLKEVCIQPDSPLCIRKAMTLATSTTGWLGDSITAGTVSTPTLPPLVLSRSLNKAVDNLGISGNTTAQMAARYFNGIYAYNYANLVVLIGSNSITSGVTGAATWAQLEPVLNDALSRGRNVIPVTMLPFGNAASWSAGRQTEMEALNTSILAWCTANSMTCVDAYVGMAEGGSPTDLAAAYDSGDGLHPNAAGSTALAALVQAAIP